MRSPDHPIWQYLVVIVFLIFPLHTAATLTALLEGRQPPGSPGHAGFAGHGVEAPTLAPGGDPPRPCPPLEKRVRLVAEAASRLSTAF